MSRKKVLRFGIALGLVVLVVGIGVAATLAVDYRAGMDCTPLSGNGVTDHFNCTLFGDRVWLNKYLYTDRNDCSFTEYWSDANWDLVPYDVDTGEGIYKTYLIYGSGYPISVVGHNCPPGEAPYTGIKLLSSDEQASNLSVPNAAGATACGVFDVNGWGAKYVGMADFPGCTAPVTVMCLNGDGEWTADTVSDVVMHGDWEVDFTSSQHGICGLFEQ